MIVSYLRLAWPNERPPFMLFLQPVLARTPLKKVHLSSETRYVSCLANALAL